MKNSRDRDVPPWTQYYASLSEADPQQTDYYRWFRKKLGIGETPDIGGYLTYVFVFTYEVIATFQEDLNYESLAAAFDLLRSGYQDTKVVSYLDNWQADAALLVGRWDESWAYKRRASLSVSFVATVRRHCSTSQLDSEDLRVLLGRNDGLTDFGRSRNAEVAEAVDRVLSGIHAESGVNLIDGFCSRFAWRPLEAGEYRIIADECNDLISPSLLKELQGVTSTPKPGEQLFLFIGVAQNISQHTRNAEMLRALYPDVGFPLVSRAIEGAVLALCRSVFRAAENDVRRATGVPEIGAGWVSESELYALIRDFFPDLSVLRHGRPDWLKPQHLDTYLPAHNIGVEYQGKQHDEPVDYFGGEDAFAEQQRRDRRKQRLCRRNGCRLIEVRKGYDSAALVAQLEALISQHRESE